MNDEDQKQIDNTVLVVDILMKLAEGRHRETNRNIWWGVGMCLMMSYNPNPFISLGHVFLGLSIIALGFVIYKPRRNS